MGLNDFMVEMRPAIEAELRRMVDTLSLDKNQALYDMIAYHFGWEGAGPEAQGKRVRPLLVLLSAAAAGGNWQTALPAAVSVELIHNFSLIHDDIQDQSLVRRGRPTLWVKWGIAQAINTGDLLFTLAQLSMLELRCKISAQLALEALATLQTACVQLTRGQYLDLYYETQQTIPLEAYWTMVGGKTAALLGCCSELGALVAGRSGKERAAFQRFGYALGLAFQVWDDWLGIWGDAEQTGKSTESDLVTGKKTLPVLYGLQQNRRFARRWRQGTITTEEVPEMAQCLIDEGAQAYVEETAEKLMLEALQTLDSVDSEGASVLALKELVDHLLQRQN
jgi:geranylgeranyl diphosphate synthase type I